MHSVSGTYENERRMADPKATLTFAGGAGTVTGANFLLESGNLKLLVDCGLNQSRLLCEHCNYDPFPYDPSSVDVLFITHAHLDHIGRVPKLVHDGFRGVIYSTPSTREIAALMFEDSITHLSREAEESGKKPLYNANDVVKALSLWKTAQYHAETKLDEEHSFIFKDAGHIMGSAMVEITHKTDKGPKKIVFTGDLGNSPTPLLRDTEPITDADYLVMESVYGDRNHETSMEERTERLKEVANATLSRGGVLLIPAFSIERTQVILHELDNLVEHHQIPRVPVYLDSPLAIRVTEIYANYPKNFNETIQKELKIDKNIFGFPGLELTLTAKESKTIEYTDEPKIIIAGSGMSYGGRILFHERAYLSDPKNTILIVGYQVPGTTGRQILDGCKTVTIFDSKIHVRAQVETISGFSAHKDSDHLLAFIETAASKLKRAFIVMGEPKASLFLAQRARDYLDVNATAPKQGDSAVIDY